MIMLLGVQKVSSSYVNCAISSSEPAGQYMFQGQHRLVNYTLLSPPHLRNNPHVIRLGVWTTTREQVLL